MTTASQDLEALRQIDPDQKVFVQITVTGRLEQSFKIRGRVLVCRNTRDSAVWLDKGVTVIAGGFPRWGGSKANPRLEHEPGTKIELLASPAMYLYILENEDSDATWSTVSQAPVEADPLPEW